MIVMRKIVTKLNASKLPNIPSLIYEVDEAMSEESERSGSHRILSAVNNDIMPEDNNAKIYEKLKQEVKILVQNEMFRQQYEKNVRRCEKLAWQVNKHM